MESKKTKQLAEKKPIDWDSMMRTPLHLNLAREKAYGLSDKDAADQLATACHEAEHLFAGVTWRHHVHYMVVGVHPKKPIRINGLPAAKGYTDVWDSNGGYGSLISGLSAANFEYILAGFRDNPIVEHEEACAKECAKNLRVSVTRDPGHYVPELAKPRNYVPLTPEEINALCSQESVTALYFLKDNWPLIRMSAIYILLNRRTTDGVITLEKLEPLKEYLAQFSPFGKNAVYPDLKGVPSFKTDIEYLWKHLGVTPLPDYGILNPPELSYNCGYSN